MTRNTPTLYMLCGKVAAGKSTLCADLARPGAIVIAQDHWMSRLYREEMQTVEDYIRLIARLRAAMGPHLVDLLRTGLSVVLDWPANTLESRSWMRGIFEQAGAAHELHYLDVSDATCLARLHERNVAGCHQYTVSDEDFERLTRYFEPPKPVEMLNVIVHRLANDPRTGPDPG
jgi:predicted kinase